MSVLKTPTRLEGDPRDEAGIHLWSIDEAPEHPAGINVYVKTKKGHVYEAQFSTEEIFDLILPQLHVEVVVKT